MSDKSKIELSEGKKALSLEQKGIEPVPIAERTTGWWSLTVIFVGIFAHLVAFAAGADYVTNIGLLKTMVCVVLGVSFVVPFYITGGWIGAKYGIPGSVAMRIAFGIKGSWVPSILNAIVAMGWFALQTTISALAFDKIIMFFGGSSHLFIWIFVWGIVYCVNALFGYAWITQFARFAVPALFLMFAFIIYKIYTSYDVDQAFQYIPTAGGLSFLFLIDATFGGWAGTSSTLVADYSRYSRSSKATLTSGITAIVVSTVIFFIGAIATIVSGKEDITETLLALSMGMVAMVLVMFATWTTNPCNTYSASLSVSNITGWNRVTSVIIMGIVGIGFALWGILEHMAYFLEVVGFTLAPANAILLVEYFIISKQKVDTDLLYDNTKLYNFWKGINPAAIAAWSISFITVILLFVFKVGWFSTPAIFSCLLAGVLYYIFRIFMIKKFKKWTPPDYIQVPKL